MLDLVPSLVNTVLLHKETKEHQQDKKRTTDNCCSAPRLRCVYYMCVLFVLMCMCLQNWGPGCWNNLKTVSLKYTLCLSSWKSFTRGIAFLTTSKRKINVQVRLREDIFKKNVIQTLKPQPLDLFGHKITNEIVPKRTIIAWKCSKKHQRNAAC